MSENSSDLEKKLMTILSNPEALSGIIAIAKGLGAAKSENTDPAPLETTAVQKNENAPEAVAAFNQNPLHIQTNGHGISDKSVGLLLSLKPFLSNSKAEKLDVITQLLKIAAITDIIK